MTFEERLAVLGVDLSDMPKVHSYEKRFAVAKNIFGVIDKELINRMNRACDLIDIIDRMETRLVNVTGERDWLKHMLCEMCDMETNGPSCAHCNVKTGGVPE